MDVLDNWFLSIKAGNLKDAISIFKNNPDIINKFTTINDGKNHYQTNAIIEASFQGNRDLVKWLIDNNADVNSVSDGGWRPIHFAAQHGHVTTVNLLVLGGAEVNVKTETNETPIFLALQAYMRDTVKKLMYHGASLIGIDRSYLHMWIQKDVLDPSCLDENNRSYLDDSSYNKSDINGYDLMTRQNEREIEEIKVVKLSRGKLITDYDSDLRRRRQELVKKMRRVNDQQSTITVLIRKVAQSDSDSERIEFTKEALTLFVCSETTMPQSKTLDHLINLLELCICDSDSSEQFMRLASKMMMEILQRNARRGDSAVVDFWCRIFDKMSNLQIEQYTMKILEMLTYMIESADETVISNFKTIKDTFLKTWEYFFENLGFPRCLSMSLRILQLVHRLVPESVNHRFHNVIDIMIGWCIHPDTDLVTLESIRDRSAELQECWLSDLINLKKTIGNLQKDVLSHCQLLARIHRPDKDRTQVDELRTKIRCFCFALSCVSAGMTGLKANVRMSRLVKRVTEVDTPLGNAVIIGVIERVCECVVQCSKQIDGDQLLVHCHTVMIHLLSCLDRDRDRDRAVYATVLRYVIGVTMPLQSRTMTEGSGAINYCGRQLLSLSLDLIYLLLSYGGHMEPSMVVQVLSPVNWVHCTLFYGSQSPDKGLLRRMLRIVDVMMRDGGGSEGNEPSEHSNQSSMTIVTTLYQMILSDLELAINGLLKIAGSARVIHLVQCNAFKNKMYEVGDQAVAVVEYNVKMLVMIHGRVTRDLCGDKLVPTVPILMCKYLSVEEDVWLVAKYPGTCLLLLSTVNELCGGGGDNTEVVKYSCRHLGALDPLGDVGVTRRVLAMVDGAVSGGMDCGTEDHVLRCVARVAVTCGAYEDVVSVCVRIVARIVAGRRAGALAGGVCTLDQAVVAMVTKYAVHGNETIRLTCIDMCYLIAAHNTLMTSLAHTVDDIQAIYLGGRCFKYPLELSKCVFTWMMEGGEGDDGEAARLWHVAGSNEHGHNRLVLIYERVVNACWDCVRQKLRFDQSADSRVTLVTIENIVKTIVTNGTFLKSINDKRLRQLMAQFTGKCAMDQMMTVNTVTLLVDVLEKMFYNAYEGCAVGMPAVNRGTETFFVTNRSVCNDWFMKARLMMAALAQYSGQWGTVVWHGLQLLSHHLVSVADVSNGSSQSQCTPEVEDCIVFTCMALSRLGHCEALTGLATVTTKVYGTKFHWIDALADKTAGHLETAVAKLEEYVRSHHDPDRAKHAHELRLLSRKQAGHSSFLLCMEEIADCHRLLANEAELNEWCEQMSVWKGDASMAEAHKSSINWGRLSCLARLSTWDGMHDSTVTHDCPGLHTTYGGTVTHDCTDTIPSTNHHQTHYTWKYRTIIDHCEDLLYTCALNRDITQLDLVDRLSSQLASVQSIADYPTALHNPDIVLIKQRAHCLRMAHDTGIVDLDPRTTTLAQLSPTLPLAMINYSNLLQTSYAIPHSFHNQHYLIKRHRLLTNYRTSEALIVRCLATFLGHEMDGGIGGLTGLTDNDGTLTQALARPLASSRAPIVQMQLQRQAVKLLWSTGHKQRAMDLLTTTVREGLLYETSDTAVNAAKCRMNTKSVLTLFQWLSEDKALFPSFCGQDTKTSTNVQFLTDLAEVPWINGLPLVSPQQRTRPPKQCQSTVTDVCGQLLILASKSKNQDTTGNTSSNNDKSFMTLAQWCLSRSRSLDETGISDGDVDTMRESLLLTMSCINDQTNDNDNGSVARESVDRIMDLLTTSFQPAKMDTDHDWLGPCYDDDEYLAELQCSLRTLFATLPQSTIDKTLILWKDYVTQHFSLHMAASDAYFSFLKDANTDHRNLCNKNRTTANLRILSLLGKRSRSLRDSIVVKMRSSAPGSWTNVIPQLFARCKHPDPSVRASVTDLLARLAQSGGARARLIMYPTIVGTMNEDSGQQTGATAAMMTSSPCHDIRKVLSDTDQSLVHEMELFIRELRRVTVLWDELWIASLSQCYEELNKKSSQLQAEIDRAGAEHPGTDNQYSDIILQLKYNSLIQPALFILERVKAATNVVPETPRESWFYDTFNEEINSTIHAIKSPANICEFKDCWKKVKELQELMITESNDNSRSMRAVKRGRHQFLSLKLGEISPSLAKMANSRIPMPGMEDLDLVSIDSHISILPTKTKPKKLQFVASNGRRYQYLYKGLEDLRLDERIMQVLGIANTMFSKLNERETNRYEITTYNVTPLGPRAGLIQMVEDATSLFTLYKRHQSRRARTTADGVRTRPYGAKEETGVSEEGLAPVRPTDIYWQKLRPKLEAAKVDCGADSRDKWPSSVLVEVLSDLRRDTPCDLLSRELWCCSINAQHWLRSSLAFTRSCAVMSMLGYVLGLGDRHLDNLLVNLSTGQMVHIDYNVCFDKGATLKVPEKVPFRLTDIITNVFGPAGVEGLFRLSCENVMDVVQQSQDDIVTMMDTFVLDPVVDWSSGIESGHYGSFEGGKFAVNGLRSVVEKRCVEFVIGLNNLQSVLVTMEEAVASSREMVMAVTDQLLESVDRNVAICARIREVEGQMEAKEEMAAYLDQYCDDDSIQCHILDHVNRVKSIEARSLTIDADLGRRLTQTNVAIADHGQFFNMMLSNGDFITFQLDLKNVASFFMDTVGHIERGMHTLLESVEESHHDDDAQSQYNALVERLRAMVVDVETMQNCWPLFEKYRTLLLDMPEWYYVSDRCSHMSRIARALVEDRSVDKFVSKMEEYRGKWTVDVDVDEVRRLTVERDHWARIMAEHTQLANETQSQLMAPNVEEEIQTLENIWQLTVYENGGINVFKAVLLEQYLEMATIASSIDGTIVTKVPDQVSMAVDYNDTARKYALLLNAHDNYFKILSNCMTVFGVYVNVQEATVVCAMMTSLGKLCASVHSLETNYVDIIMPEAVKIMGGVGAVEDDEAVMRDLDTLARDSDNILLHFNIALTSASYDINNYAAIHAKTMVPIKERVARLTDMNAVHEHTASRQLRILITSFYTTISHTYQQVADFIDCCIRSSTPSSWNYLDLVAATGLNISAMWTKSPQLLKDAVYVTGLRCLVATLEHCRSIAASLATDIPFVDLNLSLANMLRPMDVYFNFINRHIIAGVGSQCFAKMFCLLLEFAGWNLDAMIADSMPSCVISAEYICASVVSFRKTEYPNAINLYGQLQFRFNNYKNLTGFNVEPNQSFRFLSKNLSFHKSLCKLARNQLVSMYWIKKEVLGVPGAEVGGELALIVDLDSCLGALGDKLSTCKTLLAQLDSVNRDFMEVDSLMRDDDAKRKMVAERSASLMSVRTRLLAVNNAMVNIDRFECLRYRSERGREFDDEILQFLEETMHLLEELSQCSTLVTPIEEQVVQYKDQWDVTGDHWWVELRDMLRGEVSRCRNEQREQLTILAEIMVQYEQELKHLTTVLGTHFQPITSQLKTGLRSLYSITRKLKAYVVGNDAGVLNLAAIKGRLASVCRLMTLFERFNSTIESITVFTDTNLSTVDRLTKDHDHLVCLKNEIFPELFTVLMSLSPLVTDLDDKDVPSEPFLDNDVASVFGFSNNNMAESNGDQNMIGRLSPLQVSVDEDCGVDQGSALGPVLANDKSDTCYNGDLKKYINNSGGVQRAVDVWKLVESRVKKINQVADQSDRDKQNIVLYVDKLIRSARNLENLARMYEGWTAWV